METAKFCFFPDCRNSFLNPTFAEFRNAFELKNLQEAQHAIWAPNPGTIWRVVASSTGLQLRSFCGKEPSEAAWLWIREIFVKKRNGEKLIEAQNLANVGCELKLTAFGFARVLADRPVDLACLKLLRKKI